MSQCQNFVITFKGRSHEKKTSVLLDFVQMWGGALPKFCVTFSEVHFWSIIGVYFLQNAYNLNFKLFFRLYSVYT